MLMTSGVAMCTAQGTGLDYQWIRCIDKIVRLDKKENQSITDAHKHLLDVEYQKQFFSFFDDIIWHHLPDIEMEVDKKYEPCIECPPCPPEHDMPLSSLGLLQ